MDDDAPATTTWEARAEAVLGTRPQLVVEARSERTVPVKGPVMLAVVRGRIAVLPGERNQAPAVDLAATVVWATDVVAPPQLRPRRKGGGTVELKTANTDVRLAAPLDVLHAIADAFAAAPPRPREEPVVARVAPGASARPAPAAGNRPLVAAPRLLAAVPAPRPEPEPEPPEPVPVVTLPKPIPPARTPVGYDLRDGLLVPRRHRPDLEE